MKHNIQETKSSIFLKQDRVRHSKTYEYIVNHQVNALLKEDYTTYYTFGKLRTALNTYCGLSPSEYDYLKSLQYPALW